MQETSRPTEAGPDDAASRPRLPWATGRPRSRAAWIGMAIGALLATVLVVFGVLVLSRAGTALPGTSVAGRDVGGLGGQELRAVVDELVEDRQNAIVEISVAGQKLEFVPGAEGYRADVDATVETAVDAGRDGFLALPGHLRATFGETREVAVQGDAIDQTAADFVDEVADQVNQELSAGSVRVDPETLEVHTEPPRDEVVLDEDVAVQALVEVIGDPDPDPVELPVDVTEPPTEPAAVDDAAVRAQRAVSDGLVLTANGAAATLSPSDIARVLRTEEQDGRLTLVADQDVLAEVLADDLPPLEVAPVEATFQVRSGLTTFDEQGDVTWSPRPAELELVPSSPGQHYDPQVGAAQVGRLIDQGVREARLELPEVPADLTTEQARALGVDDLIGTFTTYHSCCANRVSNIHRMADLVRGQVLRPGERFSINDHVGKRTLAKGFVADGAIYRGEIRDEVGGGVSQFATTMYNASFFAGIPIVNHRAHSLYISRYPLGREATLNYDSIDLEIENDTDHGLFIHTSYTDTSITVSLFGDNGGRVVTAKMGSPYNFRDFDTRTRETNALPRGSRRVVQDGARGYQVTVERVIRGGGADRTEQIVTTYHPKPRIVEVGTADPPPPEPEPSKSKSPEPKPSKPEPSKSEPETPPPSPEPDDA